MLILTLIILFAGCTCIPGVFIFWLARRRGRRAGVLRLLRASIVAQLLVSLIALVMTARPDYEDADDYRGAFLFLGSFIVFPIVQTGVFLAFRQKSDPNQPEALAPAKPVRKTTVVLGAVAAALLISMIDRVDLEGDHTSYLVIAPYPTLGFRYGGGEEGAWQRAHPDLPPPWWHEGRYFMLLEVTDS